MSNKEKSAMLPNGHELPNGAFTYRIVQPISAGGFGNTYIAQVVDAFGRVRGNVALKEFFMRGVTERTDDTATIRVSNSDNVLQFEEQKAKLLKEANRLAIMDSPNIVRVIDVFEANGTVYYSMEFIDGQNLEEIVKQHGILPENEVRRILPQLLNALAVVHDKGFQHLDIKPANVMIRRSNGDAVLIDFGASKQLNADGKATATGLAFTAGYAPREQMEQNIDKFGPWTDLYALGATLYRVLTGKKPPMPSDIEEDREEALTFSDNVSMPMRKLIFWLMTPRRNDRPQAVAEVLKYVAGNGLNNPIDNVPQPASAQPSEATEMISRQHPQQPQAPQATAIPPVPPIPVPQQPISQQPISQPAPQQPISQPTPQQPISQPAPQQPISQPAPQQPISQPAPQQPISQPAPQQPISQPTPQQPISQPAPQPEPERVAQPAPQTEEDAPTAILTPKQPEPEPQPEQKPEFSFEPPADEPKQPKQPEQQPEPQGFSFEPPQETPKQAYTDKQPEAKSKKGLFIGIAAGAVVLIGIAAALFFLLGDDKGDSAYGEPSTASVENVTSGETSAVAAVTQVTDADFEITQFNLGKYKYTGEVDENGQPHGKGMAKFADGAVYNGPFVHGAMEGPDANYTNSDGDVFVGSFKQNAFDKGKLTLKASGEYCEGLFEVVKGNIQPSASCKWFDKSGNPI